MPLPHPPVPDTGRYHWYENWVSYEPYQFKIDTPTLYTLSATGALSLLPLFGMLATKLKLTWLFYGTISILLVAGSLCQIKSSVAFTNAYDMQEKVIYVDGYPYPTPT